MMIITPEMIVEAYEITGLKPGRGDLFPSKGCACALGAYAVSNGYTDTVLALKFLNTLTSYDYVNAFGEGFDGISLSYPEYEDAYKDGKQAWEAVKHLSDPEGGTDNARTPL